MAERVKLTEAAWRKLWERTGGEAWEPPDPRHPIVSQMIEAGYVRRTDGRCGFERIKDAMLVWTDAGRSALASQENDRG